MPKELLISLGALMYRYLHKIEFIHILVIATIFSAYLPMFFINPLIPYEHAAFGAAKNQAMMFGMTLFSIGTVGIMVYAAFGKDK